MTTRKLNLALLVCDTPKPEVLEKYGDYPTMFTNVFKRANEQKVDITWQYFDVVEKQEYPDLRDLADNRTFDGIVISGSAASAYTDLPWILKLVQFVHKLRAEPYRSQVKLVGICFGHQIIARACGGSCEKNPNGWEFGLIPVYLTPMGKHYLKTDKVFTVKYIHDGHEKKRDYTMTNDVEDDDEKEVNQVHQDHVKDLPPGFHSLATTAPHTPIHSLLSDDNQCITVQGHPEFVRQVVRILLTLRRDAGIVPKDYANEQLEKLDKEPANDDDDEWMVSKFIDFILGELPKVPKDHIDLTTGQAFGNNILIGND
ncbi:class I glutamine amidotransferase-like protein [Phascolomyces articulosus]|uniref:Class I glutamine amidotransferase-like protein n=1 Tax=Phascolomyces articulosus TaxID=60185 RepID=A0AAD5JXY0_9FUNG|nr:class I glutamine amidotransferase-like protein [Phascolomyces articulosus]